MHLQDAYVAEKGATGNGDQIGYTAPPTNVFAYSANGAGSWTATSQQKLDACDKGKVWQVTSSVASGATTAHHVASVAGKTGDAASTDACGKLTPSFTNIGAGS